MHWIIGDIHGMLRPLEAILEGITRADNHATLIFVGDYINRGSESKQVIDLLLTLNNARFIRGNHDDIFDQILHDKCYADDATEGNRLAAFQWFLQHGLDNTLCSYGADLAELEFIARKSSAQRLESTLECVPSTHRQFIRNLIPIVHGPTFFVAHGKWDPAESIPLPTQLTNDRGLRRRLLWDRFTLGEITTQKNWASMGYFGHTPVDNYAPLLKGEDLLPIRGPKLMLLDTAVALYAHGRLSAVCHEEQRILQTDRAGKLITE